MHKEELNVLGVADKEGLVAGRHHVAGLLVGAEADLWSQKESDDQPFVLGHFPMTAFPARQVLRLVVGKRTMGILVLPLNRLRTRLSIPLGLRHDRSTHLKRSLWCRLNWGLSVIELSLITPFSSFQWLTVYCGGGRGCRIKGKSENRCEE